MQLRYFWLTAKEDGSGGVPGGGGGGGGGGGTGIPLPEKKWSLYFTAV